MFLENVKHILKVSNGKVIEYIKNELNRINYHVQIFNLSPHKFNIPQQRERIFFICIRNDIYLSNPNDQIKLYYKNKNLTIDDIIDNNNNNDKYKINDEITSVLNAWDEMIKKFDINEKISPTILINDYYRNYDDETFKTLPKWKQDYMKKNKPLITKYKKHFDEWYDKYKHLLLKREIYGKLEWQTGIIKKNDSIYNHFIQFRQSGIRIKKSNYFPTLVAIVQTPIYGKLKRYITPRECARLQSFPDDFILDNNDKYAYVQLGNSVNVFNVFTIINSTFKHYGLNYQEI